MKLLNQRQNLTEAEAAAMVVVAVEVVDGQGIRWWLGVTDVIRITQVHCLPTDSSSGTGGYWKPILRHRSE